MARQVFPTHCEELGFSLVVPGGFEVSEVPDVECDFTEPAQARPMALMASAVHGAHLAVAWRPSYPKGSVTDWLAMLMDVFRIEVTGALSGFVGGETHQHPAMFVEGRQRRGEEPEVLRIVGLEDDRSFFTVHARCPQGAWGEIGDELERAAASLELLRPVGPTVPCVPGGPVVPLDMPGMEIGAWPRGRGLLREPDRSAEWEPALEHARGLVKAGRFDEADAVVQKADARGLAVGALARMYEARLRELVALGAVKRDRAGVEAVHGRALRWACGWPDPHTEDEAEAAERALREVRARLAGILGYEPR